MSEQSFSVMQVQIAVRRWRSGKGLVPDGNVPVQEALVPTTPSFLAAMYEVVS